MSSGKFNVDGGQSKEEEHVSSYTPIREAETEFRPSKAALGKSKEKLSPDGAEEKLLQKEDEAKITTRVDMADAKFVVGDHRNGDAKIELDANKRQFSGLTKEELLKYVDDPFWVRLRWLMFVLFWALWLCMLAGAIAIIVRAPRCAPPPPKTWYEIGLISDQASSVADYGKLTEELPEMQTNKVQGLFIDPCASAYDVLESMTCIEEFKSFVKKAKENSIKVIVELTANFVSTSHKWFEASVNQTGEFTDYFTWKASSEIDSETKRPKLPNSWNSVLGGEAWTWNDRRQQYYLHQYGSDQPDLNFHNPKVVEHFSHVLTMWMEAGAAGVRLQKARQLLVDTSFANETLSNDKQSGLKDYNFYWHTQTSDHPKLEGLFAHWSHLVKTIGGEETVFTIAEDSTLKPEWFRLRNNSSMLRPPSAIPRAVGSNVTAVAADLNKLVNNTWPMLQLVSEDPSAVPELVRFAVLLPATVVYDTTLPSDDNETVTSNSFPHLVDLRSDASLQHGEKAIEAVPVNNGTGEVIACARWKTGHTGFLAVFNPGETASANLTSVASLPSSLTVFHLSKQAEELANYTNHIVQVEDVKVPAKSTIVFSYVPKTAVEQ